MLEVQEASATTVKFDPYKEVNESWPADMPIPSDAEAIAGARLLLAEGFRFHECKDLNRKWKFKITSGRRHTWESPMENGVFLVNPNYRWRPGWPGIVHSISHYVHSRVHPKLGGHEMHPITEKHLAAYALARGFHLGKLKRTWEPKPELSAQEKRKRKIEAAIKRWRTKMKRAETALKKLNRQKKYYDRITT